MVLLGLPALTVRDTLTWIECCVFMAVLNQPRTIHYSMADTPWVNNDSYIDQPLTSVANQGVSAPTPDIPRLSYSECPLSEVSLYTQRTLIITVDFTPLYAFPSIVPSSSPPVLLSPSQSFPSLTPPEPPSRIYHIFTEFRVFSP